MTRGAILRIICRSISRHLYLHHFVLSNFAFGITLYRHIHSRWIIFNLSFFLHLQAVFFLILHGHLQSAWDRIKQLKPAQIVYHLPPSLTD